MAVSCRCSGPDPEVQLAGHDRRRLYRKAEGPGAFKYGHFGDLGKALPTSDVPAEIIGPAFPLHAQMKHKVNGEVWNLFQAPNLARFYALILQHV